MSDQTKTKILIAEDNDTDRLILEKILKDEGYTVITAADGLAAVELFRRERPDIILMDAIMPKMDGIEAAQKINAIIGDELIPILFLTSLQDTKSMELCLDAGAHDFLIKPYNAVILRAKLKAYINIREMHRTLQQQRDQIVEHNVHMMHEQEIAKKVFDKVAHAGCLDAPNIQYSLSPLSIFNGDVMLAAKGPTGNLLVFLGDFTGHGLNAAIGAMPLAQTFYSMAEKGFSVQNIIREINAKLHEILPVGMFCCAMLANLDFEKKMIGIWQGGLPDGLIYRPSNGRVVPVKSMRVPLGVMSNHQFNDTIDIYDVAVGDRLYIWSDGIIEAQNSAGEMFGNERLLQIFEENQSASTLFDEINVGVNHFLDQSKIDDDLSLLEVAVIEHEPIAIGDETGKVTVQRAMDWGLNFEAGPDTLRNFNALPLLMNILMEMPRLQPYQGQVYTVLSELLSNALEHGVLGLESSIKEGLDGFATYYQLRGERLEQIEAGFVNVGISYKGEEGAGRLKITVEDSGEGFDYQSFMRQVKKDGEAYSGRGILLLKSICESVEYSAGGSYVEVVFVP
jgi:CheY-like chemotaxis protein/anti-sigma regulatory factor (Ser/Thr protein kinase)